MKTTMKKTTAKVLETSLALLALAALLFIAGCSSNKVTLTVAQQATQQLEAASPWKIQSVSKDGIDQTAQFTNMTLSFTNTNFTTTNGSPLWPASGTWSFDNAIAKTFKRNDGIDVAITSISATNLTLTLIWNETTYAGGKINSTGGQYVFTFGM